MCFLSNMFVPALSFWQVIVVSIIVLAAGEAKRMGKSKQLLMLDGKPMVWWTVSKACGSQAAEVVAVLGSYSDQVKQELQGLPVKTVYNPLWGLGQAESVKAGLRAVRPDAKAVIFLPADQPLITTALLNQMIEAYRKGAGSIVVPTCGDRRSSPVLFGLKWDMEILKIHGDQGAKKLLDRFSEEVAYIPVSDCSLLMDADSPEDYRNLQEVWKSRKDETS